MVMFDLQSLQSAFKSYKEADFEHAMKQLNDNLNAMNEALKKRSSNAFSYHYDLLQSNLKGIFEYAEFLDNKIDRLMQSEESR